MEDLLRPQNLSADLLDLAIYNSIRYLNNVTGMEAELIIVYGEAEAVLRKEWMELEGATPEAAQAWGD
jgi:hypothetical protein